MAYNAVAQGEHDAFSASTSSHSASPDLHHKPSSRPLSFDLEASPPSARMSDASRGSYTPLQHPTPDLQALQGAYISNIERLEQSAERLSQSGSDIGEELRKLKLEQKKSESRRSSWNSRHNEDDEVFSSPSRQFSYGYGSHAANSIVGTNSIARSGGFSPAAYVASPRGSIRSGSRSHRNSFSFRTRSGSQGIRMTQLADLRNEHDTVGSPEEPFPGNFVPIITPPQPASKVLRITDEESPGIDGIEGTGSPLEAGHHHNDELPARPGSTNTFQQASKLFEDFDGVHRSQSPEYSLEDFIPPPPPVLRPLSESPPPPWPEKQPANKRVSSGRPISYLEPQPGESMVYYPAPVPMMLNLPQKLSKLPSAPHRDKRRSQMLSDLEPKARKAAPWLPHPLGEEEEEEEVPVHHPSPRRDRRRTMADMPPQLRASVFFDYPSVQQDIQLKGDSAVATLDSILDASAHAPVSAFTDHPIAGHTGPEVYGRAMPRNHASTLPLDLTDTRKRRSSLNLLRRNSSSEMLDKSQKRNSSALSLGNYGKRKSFVPMDENELDAAAHHSEDAPLQIPEDNLHLGGVENEEDQFHDAQESLAPEDEGSVLAEEHGDFNGAPNTLLAELQLRKQQQKLRNRQAATAYPNGMHSTLLEMDAVAQVEKRAREKGRIHLAWEDPNSQQADADNDEDVPLGMLFPTQKIKRFGRAEQEQPLGLIARRARDDNESLAQRRARLRGQPPPRQQGHSDRLANVYTHDLPSFENRNEANDPGEMEGETLAQRIKRLKTKRATTIPLSRPVSGDFASEMMSQFGGLPEAPKEDRQNGLSPAGPTTKVMSPNTASQNQPKDEPIEETLGQRRKRLQAQKQARDVSNGSSAAPNAETAERPAPSKRHSMASILSAHPTGSRVVSNERAVSNGQTPLQPIAQPNSQRQTSWARKFSADASMPMAGGVGVLHPVAVGTGLKGGGKEGSDGAMGARKGDMIDRWRQSVLH